MLTRNGGRRRGLQVAVETAGRQLAEQTRRNGAVLAEQLAAKQQEVERLTKDKEQVAEMYTKQIRRLEAGQRTGLQESVAIGQRLQEQTLQAVTEELQAKYRADKQQAFARCRALEVRGDSLQFSSYTVHDDELGQEL